MTLSNRNILYLFIYLWLFGVIIAAFMLPNQVGMLRETTTNMYFHVSMAITATVAFLTSLWQSVRYLITRDLHFDYGAEASAGLGYLFNLLALITGAIWARYAWGAYWHWDPRQTSIFILLIIYSVYFVLRGSVEDPEKRGRLSAVYSIFSFPSLIFLYYVLPRLVPGLHPGSPERGEAGINPAVSNTTDPEIRVILYSAWAGFIALFFVLYHLRLRYLKLHHSLNHNN
ncbi:MAG: cytochrome c biogenesis protein CcsA [Chloroherpetonaceae bacterium]|nr:cytochrome c biogenesis protein CcsA [Chloroherpetonaceae bacterium]